MTASAHQNIIGSDAGIDLPSTTAQLSRPSHLTTLYGEEWAVWTWVCLRGAGFPCHLVQKLAAPSAAAAATEFIEAEAALKRAIEHAAASARQELTHDLEEGRRKDLHRALKRLSKGTLPESSRSLPEDIQAELERTNGRMEGARRHFECVFREAIVESSIAIAEVAGDRQLQTAVLLQNAGALRRVLRSVQSANGMNGKRGFKERQNEELVASYLQRYCVKNDTIGFFGPVGWARFMDSEVPIHLEAGQNLVATSKIYFEHWCIEALTEKISEIGNLSPWIAPRRSPMFYLEGGRLISPGGRGKALAPKHAAVLARCNGERTAQRIAFEILALPSSGIQHESEVYQILKEFADRHIILWKMEIPIEALPDERLRRFLDRITDKNLQQTAVSMLDQLEAGRQEIAATIGDPQQLNKALNSLEETFTRLTGKPASRSSGKMYAGRTLVYNDCRRDLDLELGTTVRQALGEPLSLILDSARWFTYQAACLYREEFIRLFRKLTLESRTSWVDAITFWISIQDLLLNPESRLFNRIIPELQEKWQSILQVPWTQRTVEYTSHQLRPRVAKCFGAERPGWKAAKYHSPDIMIAAKDTEAIRTGNYMLVLGELHMAANTIRGAFAMSQHPAPGELFDAMASDLPGTHIFPVTPRSFPGLTTRTSITLVPRNHCHLEIAPDSPSAGSPQNTMPISAFFVEIAGSSLVVRTRDRSQSWDIIDFLGEVFTLQAVECMKMLPRERHTPRITIDRLVVHRETWRVPAPDIRFINEEQESARFLGARRWQQQLQLPRFVFMKVHVEDKPCYVDFESPVYIDILCKAVRRVLASDRPGEDAVISEMLPTPDQIWLPDANGQRYTSELRIVVADQTAN